MITAATTTTTRHFDVLGLRVAVSGWDEVVANVALDFAWFERQELPRADLAVVVEQAPPQYERFGPTLASFVTPRNVVYQREGATIIDYFGKAVSVLDRKAGRLLVQGEDAPLVHEAVYLFLLSRVGEHLDDLRLPRLHALGLLGGDGAVAVMLPSGGGKSTLALRALQSDSVRLLSEDSPLLDRHGRLHPFPLRIGINESDAERLPSLNVRRIERMEFHPKLALDISAFADRIEPEPQPLRHLVIGRRSLGTESMLTPLPRTAAAGPLLREMVIGVGLYQGMEFVLQHGMGDVVQKFGTAAMRGACAAAVLRRVRVWRLVLGRDHERNWDALSALVR